MDASRWATAELFPLGGQLRWEVPHECNTGSEPGPSGLVGLLLEILNEHVWPEACWLMGI